MKVPTNYKEYISKTLLALGLVLSLSFNACGGAVVDTESNSAIDIDSDTVADANDNCPDVSNPDQSDLDNDGLGDLCDDDADNDTYNNTVDCNDLDASINPGVDDLPDAKLIDNNCDGVDGTVSQAIWVAPDGDDLSGDGTIANPYKTIAKALLDAESDPEKDVYVVEGTYTLASSALIKGVRIFGGFSNLVDGQRTRDPKLHVSTINGSGSFGLFFCVASVTGHDCQIGGFTFVGKETLGGVATLVGNSIIEDNRFTSLAHAGDYSLGVVIYGVSPATITPVIRNNEFNISNTTGVKGISVGILLVNTNPANEIDATIEDNEINIGSGTLGSLGIMAFGEGADHKLDLLIRNNDITVSDSKNSVGIGLGLKENGGNLTSTNVYYSSALIEKNRIQGDLLNTSHLGISIFTNGANPAKMTTIKNNLMVTSLGTTSVPFYGKDLNAELLNNTMISNGVSSQVIVGIGDSDPSFETKVSVINNVLVSGHSPVSPGSIILNDDSVRSSFIEIENNLFDDQFTILYKDGVVPDITDEATLNSQVFATDNLVDQVQFADPSNGDYQFVNESSPGADDGQPLSEVVDDLLGKQRDAEAPSIGAYEI